MIPRFLWLLDTETGVATCVRVLRLWRWGGDFTTRRGRRIAPGHVTRMVVDYMGVRRAFSLWDSDSGRWRFDEGPDLPEGFR